MPISVTVTPNQIPPVAVSGVPVTSMSVNRLPVIPNTPTNSPETVVSRDASGNFAANNITADLIGTASLVAGTATVTATGSTTARSLANRFADVVNVKDFGAVGDGVADDTAAIQAAINASANKTLVFESGATYKVSSELQINHDCIVTTTGASRAILETTTNSGIAVDIGGSKTALATTTLAANLTVNTNNLVVANGSEMLPGRLIQLQSTKAWYHDPRTTSINPSVDATGTAQAGSINTITLKASTTATNFTNRAITIESGTGAGQARVVSSYSNATKVATVATNWSVAPDDTSVYRFAQLFKGELHLIRSVSGTTVHLDEYTFDGYDVVDDAHGNYLEDVAISLFDPITVTIQNLFIKRTPTLNADSYGFRLSYGKDCVFNNCRVDYGQATGIGIFSSYNTLVDNCEINNSNDTTTGYGSQSYGAFRSVYRNSRFLNCRRGIDFSGTTPSRLGIAEGNQVFAGGLQEDGLQYQPDGTVGSFGMGSHGTAEGTIYRNNVVGNVGRAFNLRGRNEQILNNKVVGKISASCVDLSAGMNHVIQGNYYHNQFAEGSLTGNLVKNEDNSFSAANILTQQCPYFLVIQASYQWGFTHVRDNTCRDLSRYFIYSSSTAGGTINDMVVTNNTARINPVSSGDDCGLFGAATATQSLRGCFVENNSIEAPDSANTVRYFANGMSVNSTASVFNTLGTTKTFTALLNNNSVAKIRTFHKGFFMMVALVCQNFASNRFFGLLSANSATLISMGSELNVAASASPPTGSTGSVGNITLHFDGEFIHIENRSGATRDVFLTVFPMD